MFATLIQNSHCMDSHSEGRSPDWHIIWAKNDAEKTMTGGEGRGEEGEGREEEE